LGEGTSTKEDSRSYNPWIGDLLGYCVEEWLMGICYPGDNPLSLGVFDHTHFVGGNTMTGIQTTPSMRWLRFKLDAVYIGS